jgi:aspartyl-tRNA(Asn)/glutamyl-tRNA(Gln) amidotransferase subunit B
MKYEAIIGMEVHVQLDTESKMFCGCDANYGDAPPNTHVCPVCLGMPGVLPVINKRAVEYTLMSALALNCQIPPYAKFDRKNYPYPDLVKGYQISQYDMPFSRNGWIHIETDGESKRIRIRRAHLEEDTGKSTHMGDYTLEDYNRSGVPLMEIVTEPDMRSGAEAWAYLTKLRTILRYLGVSTANMEQGEMRCEVNISVRPVDQEAFGTKVEIKNLNSFRAVRQAIDYEIERQQALLESGGVVEQVTMGWDEDGGRTVLQRSKEEANDYRYFPEPDLPRIQVSPTWIETLRAKLPELPDVKQARWIEQKGLRAADAQLLAEEKAIADYFDRALQAAKSADMDAQTISNWLTGEIFRWLNATGNALSQIKVSPQELVDLITLVNKGMISNTVGKQVLEEMLETGESPAKIVEDKGLSQISDEDALADVLEQVIAENPKPVEEYREGKDAVLGFLIGQVMKATRGKANPKLVAPMLREKIRGSG